VVGGEGEAVAPLNFGLLEKFQKIFSLLENCYPTMQNVVLKNPHLGEIWGKIEILSTLSEICCCLLEFC